MSQGEVEISDDRYPDSLKAVVSPPKVLYYQGEWDPRLFGTTLAVVGSRQMSVYGKRCVDLLVGEVAQYGVTIISGFMYGVDAAAHRRCLEVGGRTIAVLPCGLEYSYTGDERSLYQEILEKGGLVVSEYKEAISPQRWVYPKRNRIVAGLGVATLVIEAGFNSGSIITANITSALEKKVMAVPGSIFSPVSRGTLELIKGGAQAVVSGFDISKVLEVSESSWGRSFNPNGYASDTDAAHVVGESPPSNEKRILDVLKPSSLSADEIRENVEIQSSELNKLLIWMVLKGQIVESEGRYHVK